MKGVALANHAFTAPGNDLSRTLSLCCEANMKLPEASKKLEFRLGEFAENVRKNVQHQGSTGARVL